MLSSLSLSPRDLQRSPIAGIRPAQTPDMPLNVLVVAAIVDVAFSLLCLLPVVAGGMQPLCQLARRCHLQAGGMQSALLNVVANNDAMPSILSSSSTSDESTPLKTKRLFLSLPSHALRRPLFPSSPPLPGYSLSSLTASTTLRAHILETLFDAHSANHSHWSLHAS